VAHDNANAPGEHLAFVRRFIERSKERPLFLFVHTYITHDYVLNTAPYHELLTAEDAPYVAYGNILERHRKNLPLPPATFLKRLYTAGVHAADRFVDQLVKTVRDEIGDAPLLVIITSDHGESLGERPWEFGHGSMMNDAQTRIPLIAWSNVAPPLGGVVDSLVSTIDIAPSMVRWLGLAVPAEFRGRDDLLLPSPGSTASPVVIQQYAEKEVSQVGQIRSALIWNGWKYLRSDRLDGKNVSEQCYAIPHAPESEPEWGGKMGEECGRFREQFARLFDVFPQDSFVLEGNRPVEMRLWPSANGSPLLAVFSPYPSANPVMFFDRGTLSWTPSGRATRLVGYPRDPAVGFSSVTVGGRTRFKDVRLVYLPALIQRPSGTTQPVIENAKEIFSVQTRGLERPKRPPPTPEAGDRERLRALGYGDE
jgi:hypothetical protein